MPSMSTNLSPSKMSTSTRAPTFMAPSVSAFSSTSMGTSRRNFMGGRLCFAKCPRMGFVTRDSFTNSTKPIWAESYPSFVLLLCCVMTQGPACSTVAGRTSPLVSNNWVMPTFFPNIPAIFAISFSVPSVAYAIGWGALRDPSLCSADAGWAQTPNQTASLVFLAKRLNLDVHPGREIELHQRVHRLRSRIKNIEQALVRPNLELLARLLVYVGAMKYAVLVLHRRQWNRACQARTGALRRLNDLGRGLVQYAVVIRLQADANFFVSNHVWLSLSPPGTPGGKNLRRLRGVRAACRNPEHSV